MALDLDVLVHRQQIWPNWKLPAPIFRTNLKNDFFYPKIFKGLWTVTSIDLNNINKQPLTYSARFIDDENGHIIADRKFNAKSIGQQFLKNQLLEIKQDTYSPNRQLALFKNGDYMQTKVIGRRQIDNDVVLFMGDELTLQIFHDPFNTRISQTELLSRFSFCKPNEELSIPLSRQTICGEQWQAIYGEPNLSLDTDPLKTNHYKIILTPLN